MGRPGREWGRDHAKGASAVVSGWQWPAGTITLACCTSLERSGERRAAY